MKQLVSHLIGFSLATTETPWGAVRDFLFDDQRWIVRHVIGSIPRPGFRPSRAVLIPVAKLVSRTWGLPAFPVGMTTEELRQAPNPDSDPPVSRQRSQEMAVTLLSAEAGYAGTPNMLITPIPTPERNSDPHLRSFRAVRNYRVLSGSTILGKLKDLVVDEVDWTIKALVIRMRPLTGQHLVMLPTSLVRHIDWLEGAVHTNARPTDWSAFPNISPRQRQQPPVGW